MNKRSSSNGFDNQPLRVLFKDSLGKLSQISTRQQAFKQLKTLILQNKTTSNLRIWLSVLNENRNKHNQSQIQIIGFIVEKYALGLIDPLDKTPSVEKTTFRITQMLLKFFADSQTNVQLACQKAWVQIYLSVLIKQDLQLKKRILYNNLQALINGGGGKVSQTTAQFVIQGLLQTVLNKQDHEFFKQIAKRTLVLFLKTTIIHFSTLTCLQTILSFFGINNLIPLMQNIINKIISYISLSTPNSSGYKIKSQCCNAFALIGQQVDKNGLNVYSKVIKVLEDLATDKVWAVQATGRKALTIWRNKKAEWENQFLQKQQRYADNYQDQEQNYQHYQDNDKNQTAQQFYKPQNAYEQQNPNQISQHNVKRKSQLLSPPKTYQNNWMPSRERSVSPDERRPNTQSQKVPRQQQKVPLVIEPSQAIRFNQKRQQQGKPSFQDKQYKPRVISPAKQGDSKTNKTYNQGFYNGSYLQKNTGMGGGNNVQTVQHFYQQRPAQQTYSKKMQQIKKSIYNPNIQNIQYDQTIPWQQSRSLPNFNKQSQAFSQANKASSQIQYKGPIQQTNNQDIQFVQIWEDIITIYERGDKQNAVKKLLEMDDDIYFLRFLLQHGNELLKDLTRPTSSKLLKKLLSIQKTHFMEQMLFKMVGQTAKIKAGQMLTNTQNLQIIRNLQKCQKINGIQVVSTKIKSMYQKSLND